MAISRRRLLGHLSVGAAAIAAPDMTASALGASLDSSPQDTIRAGRLIRLHRNENRRGPSPKVVAAMRSAVEDAVRRYPDADNQALRSKLAKFHSVAPDHIVLGCGSGEILRSVIESLPASRKKIVAALPTFELIHQHARRAGAVVTGVRLNKDYSHDVAAMLAQTDAATGLVYICNPNNPTGTLTRRQDLEAFVLQLPRDVIFVIDEAYHDYLGKPVDSPTLIDYAVQDRKLIVTRTFSKMHALAGLRVGYAVASREMARALKSSVLSDGVSLIAARAAAAALDEPQYVRLNIERNADDRQEFLNQANARMLRSIDSVTNFVMLNTGGPAGHVTQHFAKHRVLISSPVPGFESYVRVSMGTPAEMTEFWRVWDLMPGGHHMAM